MSTAPVPTPHRHRPSKRTALEAILGLVALLVIAVLCFQSCGISRTDNATQATATVTKTVSAPATPTPADTAALKAKDDKISKLEKENKNLLDQLTTASSLARPKFGSLPGAPAPQPGNTQRATAVMDVCAADSRQVPGEHGIYGEVDATFAPAVNTLVASGVSREEATRRVLLAHARNNTQRLAIWSYALQLWANPNDTAGLQQGNCLSPEGQALWQKFAAAVGEANITLGNAPLNGIDSGVVGDTYVIADHSGINGSTEAAFVTTPSGVTMTLSLWCGNVVYAAANPVVPTSPKITQREVRRPTFVPAPYAPPAKHTVVTVVEQYMFVCDTVAKKDNVRVTLAASKDKRYAPVGDAACHTKPTPKPKPPVIVPPTPPKWIDVCVLADNSKLRIKESQYNDKLYVHGWKDCKVNPPKMVDVCVLATMTKGQVSEAELKANPGLYSEDLKNCVPPMEVCIIGSGDQTLKSIPAKDFNPKTMSTDIKDCVKPPCGCTPTPPPPPIYRCDTHTWLYIQVTQEEAKDTNRYTDISKEACKAPVEKCNQKDHPKANPTDIWDQEHCKWIPCPPPATCPPGQTPNPNPAHPGECLTEKDKDPGKYPHEQGAPPAKADPTPSAPGQKETTTETGGRGGTVVDTPINTNPTAPTGTTAPGASAPEPQQPTLPNEGGANQADGTNSGHVVSDPIDAPTTPAPATPAVANDAAAQAAAQQAAADQAAKDAADVAAIQAARAQAQAQQEAAAQAQAAAQAAAQAQQAAQAQAAAQAEAQAQAAQVAQAAQAQAEAQAAAQAQAQPAPLAQPINTTVAQTNVMPVKVDVSLKTPTPQPAPEAAAPTANAAAGSSAAATTAAGAPMVSVSAPASAAGGNG